MGGGAAGSGMGAFATIWLGQLVSIIGSGLTDFAIGIWVYQRTGSVTKFALVTLSFSIPRLLVTLLAGALVDRWDRRLIMILSDAGSALCTLALALLLLAGRLEVWNLCLIIALSSIFGVFHRLAFTAATVFLVPKRHLGRASGMTQTGQAVAQIVAPLLAGELLLTGGLLGVLVIDCATFLVALLALLLVRVPSPAASAEGAAGGGSLRREIAGGWRYIKARSGLLRLLLFFTVINFSVGLSTVLFMPLLLSFASIQTASLIISLGSVGLLAGSLAMSLWGGPDRRVYGVLGFGLLLGLCLVLAGSRPSAWLVAAATFGVLFTPPIINGCSQAIWQSKTPPDLQGRVLSVRMLIGWSASPLAYAAAGPLADNVFEPLLAPGGALAGSLGRLIGVGQGRGIGLLFIAAGVVTTLAALGGFLSPRLRMLEDELPDALPDEAAADESQDTNAASARP